MSNSSPSFDVSEDRSSFGGEAELLRMVLRDARKFPVLSREEERSLAIRAAAGDRAAEARLVESNLRFVVKIGFEYWSPGSGLSLLDLIQEGCIELIRAVRTFDTTYQIRVISYAGDAIKWGMIRVLVDHRRHKCLSLDEAIYEEDDEAETRLDRLVSEDAGADLIALHEELRRLVERLRAREREIIQQKFWKNATAAEIGRLLGISYQRILQIEARALYQLRRIVRDDQPFYISQEAANGR